jgi:hypothetical protein
LVLRKGAVSGGGGGDCDGDMSGLLSEGSTMALKTGLYFNGTKRSGRLGACNVTSEYLRRIVEGSPGHDRLETDGLAAPW